MPTFAIAPAMNADGRLELLALDTELQTVWGIMQTAPNGSWSTWKPLTPGAVRIAQLQVAKDADGRLDMFLGPGSIYHRAQVTPSGDWAGNETPPGPLWGLLGDAVGLSQFGVGANADGRLEVFAVDGDAGLAWHIWQIAPNGNWGGWQRLGDASGLHYIAAANNADGRLEAFAIDRAKGSLWHVAQVAPNGGWGSWEPLGDAVGMGPLVIGANADGRLEVFAVDTAAGLAWHIWQTTAGGNWGGWQRLGDAAGLDAIAVANNADGRLELFAVDRDAALAWHIWQTAPNGEWSGWQRLGDAAGLDAIAVANNADGRLEAFAVGRNGALQHIWQTAPNGDWDGWVTMPDPNPPSPPPPLPAKIDYLNAEPNNGYVNLGTSATLSWQVTNTQADTKAKLQGRVGLGGSGAVVFNKANVSLQGSQKVTPGEDTQYTLTVSDSRGQVSQAKWVTVYAPPTPPPGSVFYFKMTDPQSQITPCFTIAIYAKDQASAKALAEQQNGGYQAVSIDASQFMTACG